MCMHAGTLRHAWTTHSRVTKLSVLVRPRPSWADTAPGASAAGAAGRDAAGRAAANRWKDIARDESARRRLSDGGWLHPSIVCESRAAAAFSASVAEEGGDAMTISFSSSFASSLSIHSCAARW